jgi:hypothetical protein
LLWIALYFAFRIGRAERPIPPDPVVEAARAHTEALREQTAAFLKRSSKASQAAEPTAIVLAGVVNALMERALQYGFKISALHPNDTFTSLYEEIKNSIDPIWIDDEIGQLRRDFLQYCAIVGSEERGAEEMRSDRAELRNYGLKLISSLTGAATVNSDIWKAVPDAVESFADPDLIAERDKWKQTFEDALLLGYEAQDKIAALRKQMGGIFGADKTDEMGASQRKLELAAMKSDMAKDELRRAWDALRADIHTKLLGGSLIARGFRRPHTLGSPEVTIPASEWRILFLQNVTSEASTKTSSEALYEGLVIRRRLAS